MNSKLHHNIDGVQLLVWVRHPLKHKITEDMKNTNINATEIIKTNKTKSIAFSLYMNYTD
jgi:hypothetical protein